MRRPEIAPLSNVDEEDALGAFLPESTEENDPSADGNSHNSSAGVAPTPTVELTVPSTLEQRQPQPQAHWLEYDAPYRPAATMPKRRVPTGMLATAFASIAALLIVVVSVRAPSQSAAVISVVATAMRSAAAALPEWPRPGTPPLVGPLPAQASSAQVERQTRDAGTVAGSKKGMAPPTKRTVPQPGSQPAASRREIPRPSSKPETTRSPVTTTGRALTTPDRVASTKPPVPVTVPPPTHVDSVSAAVNAGARAAETPSPSPLPPATVSNDSLPPAAPPTAPVATSGSVAAARTSEAAPAPAAAAVASGGEEAAVRDVLNRYRSAYATLNVNAAKAVWPSVNTKALGRAFAGLQSQELDFSQCRIAVDVNRATAACGGTARFVPKMGNRTERLEPREWTFEMRKTGERWTIAKADVR